MPRGAKPGERRGGRSKGTKNRKTIERELLKAKITAHRRGDPTIPLAKEVLADYMAKFMALADRHFPDPANKDADVEKFLVWASRVMEAAKALAPYQSPTMRAILVGGDGRSSGDAPISLNIASMTTQQLEQLKVRLAAGLGIQQIPRSNLN